VEDLVKQVQKQVGSEIKVHGFVRYVLGEGIEKQESNFAQEVAAQMGIK
jgi:elongation factor Ts